MKIVLKLAIILFSTLLFSSTQATAFPGEARSYFQDWLVVCQKPQFSSQPPGTCRANTSIRNKKLFPYGDGTIFQLTLQRKPDNDYHLQFYHTLDDSYPSNSVMLQVDNQPRVSLNVTVEGNLARLNREQSSTLIPQIKAGRWLKISYVSKTGKPINLRLSLRGSTASLKFIEQFYYNRSQ